MIEGVHIILDSLSVTIYEYLYDSFYYMGLIPSIGLLLLLLTFIFLGKQIDFPTKNMVILFYSIYFILFILAGILNRLHINNFIFYNVMPIFLIVPLHFFFNANLGSVFWKRLLNSIALLFLFYYLLRWSKISDTLHLLYNFIFAIYILIGSFTYLIEELNVNKNRSSKFSIEFWFIVCLFFYASNSMLFWSLYDWLFITLNNKSYVSMFWVILPNSTLFIHCIIFSIALIWNRNKT